MIIIIMIMMIMMMSMMTMMVACYYPNGCSKNWFDSKGEYYYYPPQNPMAYWQSDGGQYKSCLSWNTLIGQMQYLG